MEYFTKHRGNEDGQKYADNSHCLEMDGLYLAGEPNSNNESSLVIGFEPHPDIILDENHPDFDYDKAYYFYSSRPTLQVT